VRGLPKFSSITFLYLLRAGRNPVRLAGNIRLRYVSAGTANP